jgi:hypothetical protein
MAIRAPLGMAALFALAALAGCGSESEDKPAARVAMGDQTDAGEPAATDGEGATTPAAASEAEAIEGATPMEERVAIIGILNKRNNISEDIELRPGESREIGPVIVTLAACERTPPWELPRQTGGFVQVDVRERGQSDRKRVFSGWLFVESPSVNVVEHPIYDVWIKDCQMSFPGDE